jgi:hypothetical protein
VLVVKLLPPTHASEDAAPRNSSLSFTRHVPLIGFQFKAVMYPGCRVPRGLQKDGLLSLHSKQHPPLIRPSVIPKTRFSPRLFPPSTSGLLPALISLVQSLR